MTLATLADGLDFPAEPCPCGHTSWKHNYLTGGGCVADDCRCPFYGCANPGESLWAAGARPFVEGLLGARR